MFLIWIFIIDIYGIIKFLMILCLMMKDIIIIKIPVKMKSLVPLIPMIA